MDYANAFRLDGKAAMVTGGGTGIGAEICRALSGMGASVLVTDIQEVSAADTAAQIRASGGKAHSCLQDVCNEVHWQEAGQTMLKHFGRYDILVNNAGIETAALLSKCTLEDFRRVLDVNVSGVFLGIKHAIPLMTSGGGGSIVNMSSIAGFIGSAGHASYHASKGGVRSLTKAAAVECAALKTGIRVNSVHPGIVTTAMGENFVRHYVELGLAPDVVTARAAFEAAHPLGFGAPSDVASAVLYLASDAARWLTGTELVLDGGYIAQ